MSLLELDNVHCSFDHVHAVNGISLSVKTGEFITILGPSGCGKTTTLRLIAGFETPTQGTITLKNLVVAGPKAFTPPQDRHIGMVFQDYALFPHLNVGQNIAFGLPKEHQTGRIQEILALVGLSGYEKRMPYQLSGGEQQRVAIARALAPQPDLLLLDEPFSNLDTTLRMQVRSEIRNILRQANTTCIFVTHAQDEALSLSDSVAVMFQGKIAQFSSPHALYEQPSSPKVAEFIGEANFIEGTANGKTAHCLFGNIPLSNEAYGAVTLLVRPEWLQVVDASEAQISMRVIWSEYYGHDQRVGFMTDAGVSFIARINGVENYSVGDRFYLKVRKPLIAYNNIT